ncbi:hypothetical protein ABN220_15140 [Proteus cibi]|uniref:hypothetical protein n=1 Tax=Proteus cibi TaxID=2050966 RepID=UPI0032DB78D2
MNDENEIFNRIKASLDRASSVLDIKNKIEEEIYKIVKKLEDFTHNQIEILIKTNYSGNVNFQSSNILVCINKTKLSFNYGFILFGYNIDDVSGFPIEIETEQEVFNANNFKELSNIIANVIDKASIKIMELAYKNIEELPF